MRERIRYLFCVFFLTLFTITFSVSYITIEAAVNDNLEVDILSYIGEGVGNKVISSAIGEQHIYIGGEQSVPNNQPKGFLKALDKTTFEEIWSIERTATVSDMVFSDSENTLIFIDQNGDVTSLNEEGEEQFTLETFPGTRGSEYRLDVGSTGMIATNNRGAVELFLPDGTAYGSFFDVSGKFVMDIAIDEASESVIVIGETQKDGGSCRDYRAGWMRSYAFSGELKWTNYDWTGSLAGSPQNDCADAIPQRVAMGDDGKLYMAAESAGGNSVFRWHPQIRGRSTDPEGNPYQIKYDRFTDPFDLSSQHITYFGRYEPSSGELMRNQFIISRLNSGRGNTILPREIAADSAGNVYIAGIAFASFPDRVVQSINDQFIGPYAGKDAWLFKTSPDFQKRELSTAFGNTDTGYSAELLTVAVRGQEVITGGWIDEGQIITVNPIQEGQGKSEEAFFAAWNLETAGEKEDSTAKTASFSAELSSKKEDYISGETILLEFVSDISEEGLQCIFTFINPAGEVLNIESEISNNMCAFSSQSLESDYFLGAGEYQVEVRVPDLSQYTINTSFTVNNVIHTAATSLKQNLLPIFSYITILFISANILTYYGIKKIKQELYADGEDSILP